jgi:predicted DsbA family dithiol-disulfide isomerase
MSKRDLQSGLVIDVVSDVVCPWCWIGKRRLEAAIARLEGPQPQLYWHPFQLNPDLAPEGVERLRYVQAKFGSAQRAAEIYARVRATGASVGINFEFERIERQPNTLLAHRLIAWAQAHGDASALVERLFRAFFVEGAFIGDPAVLERLASEAGFDGDAAAAFLASEEGVDAVAHADGNARELGVSGVPFFIFNGRVAVAGAQEPDTLLAAIAQAEAVLASS